MAKIKLPSIKQNIAQAVKPSQDLVRSISSKLKMKMPKAPKLKGMSSSFGSSMANSASKALSGLSSKLNIKKTKLESKAFLPKLPSAKS